MSVEEPAPFARLVRGYRRTRGLTQEQLAERAGLSERAVREIERGSKHVPRMETVQLLADALELVGAEREGFQSAVRRAGPLNTSGTRTNLPAETTPFIGRERETREVIELLRQPAVRLLTLTGTGGIGKTRLALRVAAEVLPQFEDGVFFVALASLADPDLVLPALAGALGVKEEAGQDLVETLIERLTAAHLLLLLDNVEHLLDAAPPIGTLLDACRDLHVLATSRVPLHLLREHEYAVPPLSVPDPAHLPALDQLCRYEAVALFIERARAVRADFTLTNENAGAVAAICHRLDGLPLAVELAAARVKLFPPPALLGRLSRPLVLLTGGARDRPVRHQTLRAAIDWSEGLLSPGDRDLFARLSVFAGGCTLEAAEAICALEGDREIEVMDGVASLVEKSLLRREARFPRLLMLETIREYAAERLAERGEEERLKERHARYFLGVAEEAASQLTESSEMPALNRLAQEHDNLRAALQWAQERDEVDLALRLAVALSRFWEIRGYPAEGRRRLTALLPAAETGSPGLRAAALFAAGTLAAALGDIEECTQLLERSLKLYRQLGDTRASAEVLDRSAYQFFMWQCGPDWISAVEEHLVWGREAEDKLLVATALHWLAWGAVWEHNTGRARSLGEESLALFRDLGNTKGTVDALLILVDAAYCEVKVPAARALCEEVIALMPQLSLDASTRERMQFVAYRAREEGDYESAMRLMDAAMTRALDVGDARNAAYARTCLALLVREQGEYDRATTLYRESLAVFQEIEDRWGRCTALLGLSDVARDLGEAKEVMRLCRQALQLAREIGSPMQMGFALHNLALAARAQAQYGRAGALLDESLAVFHGPPDGTAEIVCSVGLVALDQGQGDRAEEAFLESLHTARPARMRWLIGTLLEGLAGVAVGRGQPERAARLLGAADALRATIGTPISPANRPRHERDLTAARAAVGAETFERLVDEGRTMTAEQALSHALGEATPC